MSFDSALLIVLGEPINEDQTGPIIQRVIDGLSAWIPEKTSKAQLSEELSKFVKKSEEPEQLETGGSILRSTDYPIYMELLITPGVQSLHATLIHFLTLPAAYKHIVHAGPLFANSGSWILRDGTLSLHDFTRILHRPDVVTALTETTPGSTLTVSCFSEGEWNEQGVKHHGLEEYGKISIGVSNGELATANLGAPSCESAVREYASKLVQFTPLSVQMPPSDLVGSIRFRRPTIYIFPAGQGDAALFGVDGFLLLIDGGFQKKTCFWDFVRHVDNLDGVLVSGVTSSNVLGTGSFLEQLATTHCAPKVCHAFGTIPEVGLPQPPPVNYHETRNPLLISLYEEGAKMLDSLACIGLKSQICGYAPPPVTPKYPKYPESIILYEKVGHGRLEMYVLNPIKESKEFAEFVESWRKQAPRLLAHTQKLSTKPGGGNGGGGGPSSDPSTSDYHIPVIHRCTLAVLLVWHPAEPDERIVRVLYPASCPQERILVGMERLKCLDFLKYPYCTAALLDKKLPLGAPAGMKAALMTKKPHMVGKTAAEMMAEGVMPISKVGTVPPPPTAEALAAALAPVQKSTRRVASPPSPTTVQSPALDSDAENGGAAKDEMSSRDEEDSTPVESQRAKQAGFSIEAEPSHGRPYESLEPATDEPKNSTHPEAAGQNRAMENIMADWGEPLALPPLPAKKDASKPAASGKPVPKRSAARSVDSATRASASKSPSLTPSSPTAGTPSRGAPPVKSSGRASASSSRRPSAKPGGVLKKQSSAVHHSVSYVDLAYIPHQGNPYYCNIDFFKHIRSKYYVISSLNPPKETFDALLAGKRSWNAQDESVVLIPTYDSDTLSLWMGIRKDELAFENVDVSPSCIRCSINLEEHTGATCAAYRLEL